MLQGLYLHGLSIESQHYENLKRTKIKYAKLRNTADLLNIVNRAVNVVAQDVYHLAEVYALVNVELELVEMIFLDASNLSFDLAMQTNS